MLIGVGVSCRISYSIVSYLYVSLSGLKTSVGEQRANVLLSFTCIYMVSVWIGFLFRVVLGIGCVILLYNSLDLPYNYCSLGTSFCFGTE